jgi:hypothetical protein
MNERSPKVRKSGSPKGEKGDKKSEVRSPESEKPPAAERPAPTEPDEKLNTDNSKLPTENMEVHHHPQLEHKAKPWKEYVLEGLMIFLAVFMGFIAENIREHINEKSRAHDFAVTLYADLKADTAEMHDYLKYHKFAVANVDTLMQLLSANDPKDVSSGKLYWFGLWGGAFRMFIPHDATLTEMKSSGSLRFFANLDFSSKLEQYDQLCQNLKAFENLSTGTYTETRKYRAQLFNFKYNAIVNNISAIKDRRLRQVKVDSFMKTNPPLLSADKVLFNQYVEYPRFLVIPNLI